MPIRRRLIVMGPVLSVLLGATAWAQPLDPPEQGILADYTRGCRIVHNTIDDPNPRLRRLIRLVHDNDGLVVAGNLLSGPPLRVETTSRIEIRGNVTRDLAGAFVDARLGNLHLKRRVPGVADAAHPLTDVARDIDRQKRDARPDVGADEFNPEAQPER